MAGRSLHRTAAAVLWLALGLSGAAVAQAPTPADIAALEALADDGSFDAMLRLGLAYDLGTGVAPDRRRALDWYLRAASAGDPDGQFNAAVTIDAGLVPGFDDPALALHWYTRAATNGQARAQYNLGLIYAAGDGVAANPAMARYWFARAADTLPAARAKLESTPSGGGAAGLSVPAQATGALVAIDTGRFAEMTWAAPPGPEGVVYAVEIRAWSDALSGWTGPIFEGRTEGSGLVALLEMDAEFYAWRVAMVDPATREARATPWLAMGDGAQDLPPDTPFRVRPDAPARSDPLGDRIRARIGDALDDEGNN